MPSRLPDGISFLSWEYSQSTTSNELGCVITRRGALKATPITFPASSNRLKDPSCVGHSYAGSVIANAANGNDNVKGLVFVAGFAPEAGESAIDLSGRFPGSTLGPALAPSVVLSDGSKDSYIDQSKFQAQFAADVPEAEAVKMAATQRPVTEAALAEPAGQPAWKTVPSWFIYGSLDKNIPAAVHAFMAKRAGAKETIEVKGASHVVMISHPREVAALIEQAASAKHAALAK
jgi:pimeloyl-ACP methyl ester carboxylesterase